MNKYALVFLLAVSACRQSTPAPESTEAPATAPAPTPAPEAAPTPAPTPAPEAAPTAAPTPAANDGGAAVVVATDAAVAPSAAPVH